MRTPRYWLRRVTNGLRKVAAGLRPFNESVWPGTRNDLFVAHESIYHFALPLVKGAAVLDAGCGTGYGANLFAEAGASLVTAIDIDPRTIGFARRRYSNPRIQFAQGNCEALELPASTYDVVFASNMLEHLEHPERFLASAFKTLRPGGHAVLAVPPITSEADLRAQDGIHYHRSNLSVSAWLDLLRAHQWSVRILQHRFAAAGPGPDFYSPFPSKLSTSDFEVTESSLDGVYRNPPLTAIFLAQKGAA
jgi:SAM-dependent methyltransferase